MCGEGAWLLRDLYRREDDADRPTARSVSRASGVEAPQPDLQLGASLYGGSEERAETARADGASLYLFRGISRGNSADHRSLPKKYAPYRRDPTDKMTEHTRESLGKSTKKEEKERKKDKFLQFFKKRLAISILLW